MDFKGMGGVSRSFLRAESNSSSDMPLDSLSFFADMVYTRFTLCYKDLVAAGASLDADEPLKLD